jgi:hypothetical protein
MIRWGLMGVALAGGLVPLGVSAQDQGLDLGPPARPVVILLANRPVVTVDVAGDYGPVRVTGTLEAAPQAALDLGSREVDWSEVRSISRVVQPSEGFPADSFRVSLVTDDVPATQAAGTGSVTDLLSAEAQGTWRALRLPEGALTLKGEPYGTLKIPTARINQLRLEPVQGDVQSLPAGTVRVEVLPGSVVSVPLPQVQYLQRDLRRGTITVILADDQTFSGKLLELPKVSIQFAGEKPRAPIPLDRIVVLERRTPSNRRL